MLQDPAESVQHHLAACMVWISMATTAAGQQFMPC
jgi:hypothetical protein